MALDVYKALTRNWLKKTGDTMIAGDLTLFRNPSLAMHAVTKAYVDSGIAASKTPPGGVDQNFQFNDTGIFGGSPSLLYDKLLHKVSIAPVAGDIVQIGRALTTGVTFGDAVTGDFVAIRPVSGGSTYANYFSVTNSGATTPVFQINRFNQTGATALSAGELAGGTVGGEAFVATAAVIGGTTENGGSSCVTINSNGSTSVNLQGRSRSTGVPSNRVIQIQGAGSRLRICATSEGDNTNAAVAMACDTGATNNNSTTNVWGLKLTNASPSISWNVGAPDPSYFHGLEILAGATRSAGTQKLVSVGIHCGSTGNAQYNRGLLVENGVIQAKKSALTLANGANDDIGPITSTIVRIDGPTGAFNITSIRGGGAAADVPLDGEIIILWNSTAQNMTITNAAATGTAANRITTSTGADLVTAGVGAVALWYDAADSRWHDFAFQP